jgi:hypothetical protein
MAAFTHVLEYDGGIFTREIGPSADINVFADTLRRFDGVAPWALSLWARPDGKGHEKMLEAGEETAAYLQAGGRHDAMTVQIRSLVAVDGALTRCARSSGIPTTATHRRMCRSHYCAAPRWSAAQKFSTPPTQRSCSSFTTRQATSLPSAAFVQSKAGQPRAPASTFAST